MAHVQRHGTTSKGLTDVLTRKVKRDLHEIHAQQTENTEDTDGNGGADDGERAAILEEALGWVTDVVAALEGEGSLNDQLYAELFARSLHRSGKSRRLIQSRLAQKGVSREHADRAIGLLGDESDDIDGDAATEFARKRRFGAFRRRDIELDDARRRKELGAFARAGFSFDLARRMVEAEPSGDRD